MKILLIILAVVAVVAITAILVLRHPAFGPYSFVHRTSSLCTSSPNWRNGMFQNEEETPQFTGDKSPMAMLWDFIAHRPKDRVPQEALPVVKTDLKSLPTDRDWLVWFGHSSYMFCLHGKRYLVDPLLKMEFPAAVMMKPFAGTNLYTPDDMPEIDCLIITHEHWDHLDYATLRDLRPKVKQVVCPLGVGEYLEYWKYDKSIIHEMDWMDVVESQKTKDRPSDSKILSTLSEQSERSFDLERSGLKVTCLPTRHFSNRLLGGRNQTLWASFMVEDGDRKVYIGGDGGFDGRFKRIHEQFGEVDLALLENGQYNNDWKYIHTTPESLEQAILDLGAKGVFTVHHDKFALAKHPWYEPDSVAHSIAERHDIQLLDQPIGTVVYF